MIVDQLRFLGALNNLSLNFQIRKNMIFTFLTDTTELIKCSEVSGQITLHYLIAC